MPDDSGCLTLAELEEARPLVERSVGRELRQAERVVDVFKLNAALEKAKADLFLAIRAEQRRAVRLAVLTDSKLSTPIHFAFTSAMAAPLDRLRALGKREARAELRRAGYDVPARSMIAEPTPGPEGPHGYVRNEIAALKVKIRKQRVSLEAGGAAQDAVLAALYTVPGAMDIASRVVSTALSEGFSSTFSDVADLVSGWEYTAVLDGGTCDECEALDGETFATWEEIEGLCPNPDCEGGGRCRCEPVPLAPTDEGAAAAASSGGPTATGDSVVVAPARTGYENFTTVSAARSPQLDRFVAGVDRTLSGSGITIDELATATGKTGMLPRAMAQYARWGEGRKTAIMIRESMMRGKALERAAAKAVEAFAARKADAIAFRERAIAREETAGSSRAYHEAELANVRASGRWTVVSDAADPIFATGAHEAGHALLKSTPYLTEKWSVAIRDIPLVDRYRLSEWAGSSKRDSELFAEAMSMRAQGRELPLSIERALKEIGL